MKTSNASIAVSAFVLIAMITAFITASLFPYKQAKIAPMTLAGIMAVLAAVQLVKEFRSRSKTQVKSETTEEEDDLGEKMEKKGDDRRYFMESAWMIGFIALIYILGFLIAIPLFELAYMRFHGVRWRTNIVIAAVTLVIVYLLFTVLLDFKLYPGWIPEAIMQ